MEEGLKLKGFFWPNGNPLTCRCARMEMAEPTRSGKILAGKELRGGDLLDGQELLAFQRQIPLGEDIAQTPHRLDIE